MGEYTRTREKSEPAVTETGQVFHEIIRYRADGSISSTSTDSGSPTSGTSGYSTQVTSDVEIPNFHKLSKQGRIFINPFITQIYEDKYAALVPYEYYRDYRNVSTNEWVTQHYHGMATGKPPVDLLDSGYQNMEVGQLIDQAVLKAHANTSLANAQAMMMAAEGRKTIESLADILKRAIRIVRKAKKLDLKAIRAELSPSELADRYMEIRYALRPLVYDAKSVIEACEASTGKSRQTFRGFTVNAQSKADTVELASGDLRLVFHRTDTVIVSVSAGILTDINATQIQNWGGDQFLETLLELTPYSFIANWLFNISDYLAAWTPNVGVVNRGSWYTIRHERIQTVTSGDSYHVDLAYPYEWINESVYRPMHRSVKTLTKQRVVNPDVPTLPQFRVNLDPLKIIDLGIIGKKILNRSF